jgi:peptide/nickel transport system permease protein
MSTDLATAVPQRIPAPAGAAWPRPTLPTGERTKLGLAAPKQPTRQLGRNLRRFLVGNRLNLIGASVVVLFCVLALVGETIAPHNPTAPDIEQEFQAPSWRHPMGTDNLGRDVFSRIVVGTRISFQVAAVVLAGAVLLGTLVGAVAGYAGGLVDELLMRLTDLFLAFPALVLAIAVAATLGKDLRNTMIALSTVFWPWYARLVRGQVLALKRQEFVTAAHSLGLSAPRILLRHVLPNCLSVIVVQVSLDVGYAILATSSLSFVGLGAQPPSPEWGTMLAEARSYLHTAWWYFTFPGLALTLTVFAFNVLGDGLQEALDPRSAARRS